MLPSLPPLELPARPACDMPCGDADLGDLPPPFAGDLLAVSDFVRCATEPLRLTPIGPPAALARLLSTLPADGVGVPTSSTAANHGASTAANDGARIAANDGASAFGTANVGQGAVGGNSALTEPVTAAMTAAPSASRAGALASLHMRLLRVVLTDPSAAIWWDDRPSGIAREPEPNCWWAHDAPSPIEWDEAKLLMSAMDEPAATLRTWANGALGLASLATAVTAAAGGALVAPADVTNGCHSDAQYCRSAGVDGIEPTQLERGPSMGATPRVAPMRAHMESPY